MHQKQEMVSVPWTLGEWAEGSDTAAAWLQGGAGPRLCAAALGGVWQWRPQPRGCIGVARSASRVRLPVQSCPFPVKLLPPLMSLRCEPEPPQTLQLWQVGDAVSSLR